MSGATSYRVQVRAAIAQAILGANTLAGTSVYGPRDWPTAINLLSCVIVQPPPRERMESLVRGAPSFTTTALIPVTARVSGTTIAAVDSQIETLLTQIKGAVLSSNALYALIQQVALIETQTVLTAEGQHQIGELGIIFACEYPEFFDAAPGVLLTEFQSTITDQTSGETLATFDAKL